MGECAKEPPAGSQLQAVGCAAKFAEKVKDAFWYRPLQREMASNLGARVVRDKQRVSVGCVRWQFPELIAPLSNFTT